MSAKSHPSHGNVNRLLENSHRSDLFGKNLGCSGHYPYKGDNFRPDTRRGGTFAAAQWMPPAPGLPGAFILGHHTPIDDALSLSFTVDGQTLEGRELTVTRHRWTPAWQDTYYRTPIDEDVYPFSGTTVFRERKTVSYGDVYTARLTITNEKRTSSTVTVRLSMPFAETEGATGRIPKRSPRHCAVITASTALPPFSSRTVSGS